MILLLTTNYNKTVAKDNKFFYFLRITKGKQI